MSFWRLAAAPGQQQQQHQQQHQHQIEQIEQTLSDISAFVTNDEELTLLPPAGSMRPKHTHKQSFSEHAANAVHSFQVAMFKPALAPAELLAAVPGGGSGRGSSTQEEDEPFLTDLRNTMHSLRPDQTTSEWLRVGLALLPKISWGWLPFCFGILGFSLAFKLLLGITLFSVYSAAILYRLWAHSDVRGTAALADVGEAAFGKRLGRRPVVFFVRLINVALPTVCHVGGTRFLQAALFATTPLCLPWISLLFGAVVLGLAQVQRLGAHPALQTVVQPVLAGAAVAGTVLKLLLMGSAAAAARVAAAGGDGGDALAGGAVPGPAPSPAYLSDYVIAIVQLISANYMTQHLFLESMSDMSSPATFQHSTAWAQVITLLANLAVALATLRVPGIHVRGFISNALGHDLLGRFISLNMWLLMTVKYVVVLHLSTQRLLPRLPHLLVRLLSSSEVDSRPLHLAPRQLWLICSTLVVLISFLVSCTFPHTFLYLTGLLTSIAYIPLAFTLPCLFSLKLLANHINAIEYTLSTWVVPVSIGMSLMGAWASMYHLVAKWESAEHGGAWGCNLLQN